MSGQGVATTSTARTRPGSPDASQAPPARASVSGVNHTATRSARRWIGGRSRCAASIKRTIWAYSLSVLRRTARISSAPSALIAPLRRAAPGALATGSGSPVSADSSTEDSPASTTPSTGISSPGRTSSRSPTCTSATGRSSTSPPAAPLWGGVGSWWGSRPAGRGARWPAAGAPAAPARSRWATLGARSSSAASASEARRWPYASSAWPVASIITTTTPARYSPWTKATTRASAATTSAASRPRATARRVCQTKGAPASRRVAAQTRPRHVLPAEQPAGGGAGHEPHHGAEQPAVGLRVERCTAHFHGNSSSPHHARGRASRHRGIP